MSPTARTLKHLRDGGWTCAVVEKRVPHSFITQDLFGVADVLAFNRHHVLLVQTTSGGNVASRIKKILASPYSASWLESEYRSIEVHGWRKGGRVGAVKRWVVRVVPVTREMAKAAAIGREVAADDYMETALTWAAGMGQKRQISKSSAKRPL